MLDNKLLDKIELGIIRGVPATGFVLRDVVGTTISFAGKEFSSKITCHEMYTRLVANLDTYILFDSCNSLRKDTFT
jgi:hypothetical protein